MDPTLFDQVPHQRDFLRDLKQKLCKMDVRISALFRSCDAIVQQARDLIVEYCLTQKKIAPIELKKNVQTLTEEEANRIAEVCGLALQNFSQSIEVRCGPWCFYIPDSEARKMLSLDQEGNETKTNPQGLSLVNHFDGFHFKVTTGTHNEPLKEIAASLFAQKLDPNRCVMVPSILLSIQYGRIPTQVQVTRTVQSGDSSLGFRELLANHYYLTELVKLIGRDAIKNKWKYWTEYFAQPSPSYDSWTLAKEIVEIISSLKSEHQPKKIREIFPLDTKQGIIESLEIAIRQSDNLENWKFTLNWIKEKLQEDDNYLVDNILERTEGISFLGLPDLPALYFADEVRRSAARQKISTQLLDFPADDPLEKQTTKLVHLINNDSFQCWKIAIELLQINPEILVLSKYIMALPDFSRAIKTLVKEIRNPNLNRTEIDLLLDQHHDLLMSFDEHSYVPLFVSSAITGQTDGHADNIVPTIEMISGRRHIALTGIDNDQAFAYTFGLTRKGTLCVRHKSVLYTLLRPLEDLTLASLPPIQSPVLFLLDWIQLIDALSTQFYPKYFLELPKSYLVHMLRSLQIIKIGYGLSLSEFFQYALPDTYAAYHSPKIQAQRTPDDKFRLLKQEDIEEFIREPPPVETVGKENTLSSFEEAVRTFLQSPKVEAKFKKFLDTSSNSERVRRILNICCGLSFNVKIPQSNFVLAWGIKSQNPDWVQLAIRSGTSHETTYSAICQNLLALSNSRTCIKLLDTVAETIDFNSPIEDHSPLLFRLIDCPYFDEELIRYLQSKNVNLNCSYNGLGTPLDQAIEKGKRTVFRILVMQGAGAYANPRKALNFAKENCDDCLTSLFKNCPEAERIDMIESILTVKEYDPDAANKDIFLFSNLKPNLRDNLPLEEGKFQPVFDPINKPEVEFKCKREWHGARTVLKVSYRGLRFHLKENPEMPGWQYAVCKLFQILVGHGTSISELILLKNPRSTPAVIQVSKTVDGKNLHSFLTNASKGDLEKIDLELFHDLVLTSFLTRPEDDFPENYIVRERGEKWEFVGIDLDHVFTDSINEDNPDTPLKVKSILYCFDQMLEKIDQRTASKFSKLDPYEVLFRWLQQLDEKQKKLYETFDIETRKALWPESFDPITGISIIIPPGMIQRMYQRLRTIQSYLKNPDVRPIDLLLHFLPDLGRDCERELKDKNKTPLRRCTILFGNPALLRSGPLRKLFSIFRETTEEQYRSATSRELLSFLSKQRSDVISNEIGKYSPCQAIKDLRRVEEQTKNFEQTIQNTLIALQQGDTEAQEALENLKVDALFSELLTRVDFSLEWAQEIEQRIISTIKRRKIQLSKITLQNSRVSSADLIEMFKLSSELTDCDLSGCHALTREIIPHLPSSLRSLSLPSSLSEPTLSLPGLLKLTLRGYKGKVLQLKTPNLEKLILVGAESLTTIATASRNIHYLDVRGCKKLIPSELKKFLQSQGNLRTVFLDEDVHLKDPAANLILEKCGNLALHALDGGILSRNLHELFLRVYKNPRAEALSLSKCGLNDQKIKELSEPICILKNLNSIDLSDNFLSGAGIALLISYLPKTMDSLQSLDLSGNSLDENAMRKVTELLLRSKKSVKKLALSRCELSNSVASVLIESLPSLTILEDLDLSSNPLNGEVVARLFAQLAKSPSVKTLNISGLQFNSRCFRWEGSSFFSSSLSHLDRMIALKCQTDLEETFVNLILSLPDLLSLEIDTQDSLRRQAAISAWLFGENPGKSKTRLQHLAITGPLAIQGAKEFPKSLTHLHLTGVHLSAEVVQSLRNHENLTDLKIKQTNMTPLSILFLSNKVIPTTQNLQGLSLNNTILNGEAIQALSSQPHALLAVQNLSLSNAGLESKDIDHIPKLTSSMKHLHALDLSMNRISHLEALSAAKALKKLRVLNLSKNNLTFPGLLPLKGNLPNLISLDLCDLKCLPPQAKELGQFLASFPKLRHLNLSESSLGVEGFIEMVSGWQETCKIPLEELSLCSFFSLIEIGHAPIPWEHFPFLKKIRLSHHETRADWIHKVCASLLALPKLHKLELDFCSIGDDEVKELVSLFETQTKTPPKLKILSLRGNLITPFGANLLLEALRKFEFFEVVKLNNNQLRSFLLPRDLGFKVLTEQ